MKEKKKRNREEEKVRDMLAVIQMRRAADAIEKKREVEIFTILPTFSARPRPTYRPSRIPRVPTSSGDVFAEDVGPSTNIKVHRSSDLASKRGILKRRPRAAGRRLICATVLSIHKVHLILFARCGTSINPHAVPRRLRDWLCGYSADGAVSMLERRKRDAGSRASHSRDTSSHIATTI